MKSSELKLGHAYKLAGKEGPAFFINTHPHDGGTMIMAWNDVEEDEEKYLAVDSCEIEYEIPVSDTLMVFTDQYEAFLLAGRVLSSLPSILEHVKAIETRAADVQKTATSQGDSLWHSMETIDDRVHDLLTLLEDGEFRALTGADLREQQMAELRRNSYRYAKARAHAYKLGIGNPTPEEFDALVDAIDHNARSYFVSSERSKALKEALQIGLECAEACQSDAPRDQVATAEQRVAKIRAVIKEL